MRAVLWTAEEEGLVGAFHYYDLHKVRWMFSLLSAEGKGFVESSIQQNLIIV